MHSAVSLTFTGMGSNVVAPVGKKLESRKVYRNKTTHRKGKCNLSLELLGDFTC